MGGFGEGLEVGMGFGVGEDCWGWVRGWCEV